MPIKWESTSDLGFDVSGELWFPSVTIFKQLLFVVKQFLMGNGSVLKVRSFNDSINRAGSLAESTIDAFGHVDIILGGSSGSIRSGLTFNCDGLSWTSSSTQFTGDTSTISLSITFPLQWHISSMRVHLWILETMVPFRMGNGWSIRARKRTGMSKTRRGRNIQDWSTLFYIQLITLVYALSRTSVHVKSAVLLSFSLYNLMTDVSSVS